MTGDIKCRAWALLAALVALNTLNFIDRTLPQAFIVAITSELELSYTQFALIAGPLFAVVYAVAGLGAGVMADRMNRPRLIAIGVTLWSAMTAASGLARDALQFGLARAFIAVGESTLSPSALSLLAHVFPERSQGMATSLYYLGISLGAGGAYLIAGAFGETIGWRACFIALGVIGLLLALLMAFLKDPRDAQAGAPTVFQKQNSRRNIAHALRCFISTPSLGWLWLASALITFSQGASILDQAWLVRERGFTIAEAQSLVGAIFLAGSTMGAIVGGPISDWCARSWRSGRLFYLIALVIVLIPSGVALRFAPEGWSFVLLLFIGSAGFTLPYGAILPSVFSLAPEAHRGIIIGATLLGMALVGTSLGNVCAGVLADVFSSEGRVQPLRDALVTINLCGLLAAPCLWAAIRGHEAPAKVKQY